MEKALPAAIFLTSWIPCRALWVFPRASQAAWRAWESLESFPVKLYSKVSHFLTASCSSCSALITLASCFSRRVRSMAAFFSASAMALLRASTSVITPSTNYVAYFILSIYFTIHAHNACAYLVYPSTAFSIGQVLLWPAPDFDSVRRSPQYERQQSLQTPAYNRRETDVIQ